MTQLSDLYNADLRTARADVSIQASVYLIPHPLHGVEYADGVILCGRQDCSPCREYRSKWCAFQSTDPWDGYCRCDLPKHPSSQAHQCRHGAML